MQDHYLSVSHKAASGQVLCTGDHLCNRQREVKMEAGLRIQAIDLNLLGGCLPLWLQVIEQQRRQSGRFSGYVSIMKFSRSSHSDAHYHSQ